MTVFSLALLSLMLHSAGSATTVLVMRHCARFTGSDDEVIQSPTTPFSSDNNYSAQPWPAFTTESMSCTPRGAKIIEGQGRWMRTHGKLPQPISAMTDVVERDVETGKRFMKGLQAELSHSSFESDKRPFFAQFALDTPKCMETFDRPPGLAASLQAAFRAHPELEAERNKAMSRLFEIMGKGASGDWTKLPCTVNMSNPPQLQATGSCQVAYVMSEHLLMKWAAGLEVGWGHVEQPAIEFPYLHQLASYYFKAVYGNTFTASRLGAELARRVLEELQDGTAGTKIFIGHDADLAALSATFGLRWDASPFGVNESLPGSFLRFDFDKIDTSVQATYNFVPSFADSRGEIKSAPADFGLEAGNKASLAVMKDLLEKNTVPECLDTHHTAKDIGGHNFVKISGDATVMSLPPQLRQCTTGAADVNEWLRLCSASSPFAGRSKSLLRSVG